jgi:predicted AAA+ superfamily ATPase
MAKKARRRSLLKFKLLNNLRLNQARKYQASLLPGRIHNYQLGTFTFEELKNRFETERALRIGLLPGVYLEESLSLAEKTLQTYGGVYLREEIEAEALTRNLDGFSRFFKIVSSRSGDFIDFTKFSSHAMIERMSAKRYFDILCDTLVLNCVEPFTKSSKRRLVQHPRFYFFDVYLLTLFISENSCILNEFVQLLCLWGYRVVDGNRVVHWKKIRQS